MKAFLINNQHRTDVEKRHVFRMKLLKSKVDWQNVNLTDLMMLYMEQGGCLHKDALFTANIWRYTITLKKTKFLYKIFKSFSILNASCQH